MSRLPTVGIPAVRSGLRKSGLLLIPLLLVAFAVKHTRDKRDPNSPIGVVSELKNGYAGPPVKLTVEGPRTKSPAGICLIAVRDGSSSVTEVIDPDRQVNKELGEASEAMAASSLDADSMAAVVFANDANSSPLLPIGDVSIPQHLLTAEAGSGTDVKIGLSAAADLLAQCPAGSVKNVVLVTDGLDSESHISDGLRSLSGDVHLELVILETPEWENVAPWWQRSNTTLNIVPVLRAGSVANIVATRLSALTGQSVSVTYGAV
jgi:hypothetical protein